MNPDDIKFDPEELRRLFSGDIDYPNEIGFYLDESTHHGIQSLWSEGIAVITVEQESVKGESSDIRILAYARRHGYILVTKDRDFEETHAIILSIENGRHAGIILARSENAKNHHPVITDYIIKLANNVDFVPDILENQIITL